MQVVATAQTGGGGSARGLLGKERAPLRALSRRGALHGAPPVRQQLQDPGSQQIVVLGARHSEKPAGGDLLALSGSSKCAQAFLEELSEYMPFPLVALQTDNGSEFLKHFDSATEEKLITHYFSHPHCPKENSHVERKIQRPSTSSGLTGKPTPPPISTSWSTAGTTPTITSGRISHLIT